MGEWDMVKQICLLAFLAAAAFCDIRTRRIPNWLTVAAAIAGLLYAILLAPPEDESWFGLAIGFGVMLLLYLIKGVGAGDVKMMVGVGLFAGYPAIIYFLFYSSLAALLIMLAPRAWRGELWASIKRSFRRAKPGEADGAGPGPISGSFALALLIGVVWVWIMEMA